MKNILSFEFKKIMYNPFSLVLSIGIPIIAIVLVGVLLRGQKIGENQISAIDYFFPSYSFLISLAFSGAVLPFLIGIDRIDKRIKQLSICNITIYKYILSVILFNLTLYYIGFVIMILISLFAFGLSESPAMILTSFLFPVVSFSLNSLISITISNIADNFKSLVSFVFIIFYIGIFLSGSTIPLFLFPDWWKYVEYILPQGLCLLITQNLCNSFGFAKDWFVFIILIFYFFLFAFLAYKTFNWE